MKIEIEDTNNGFFVKYHDGTIHGSTYIFRSVDDLLMLEDIAKRFLKRKIKVTEQ